MGCSQARLSGADASVGELASLEELLAVMMQRGLLPAAAVRRLWDYILQRGPHADATAREQQGAMSVVAMLGRTQPAVVRPNLEALVEVCVDRCGRGDLILFRHACLALKSMAPQPTRRGDAAPAAAGDSGDRPFARLVSDDALFASLVAVLATVDATPDAWPGAAEAAVGAVYALAEQPDVVCADFLRRVSSRVLPTLGDARAAEAPRAQCSSLAHLVFLVGHVALRHLVHLEDIESELKRRRRSSRRGVEERESRARSTASAVAREELAENGGAAARLLAPRARLSYRRRHRCCRRRRRRC